MALIGEQFDEADEICGVVASVRQRQDKLSLWTKNAANEAAQVLNYILWYHSVVLDMYLGSYDVISILRSRKIVVYRKRAKRPNSMLFNSLMEGAMYLVYFLQCAFRKYEGH